MAVSLWKGIREWKRDFKYTFLTQTELMTPSWWKPQETSSTPCSFYQSNERLDISKYHCELGRLKKQGKGQRVTYIYPAFEGSSFHACGHYHKPSCNKFFPFFKTLWKKPFNKNLLILTLMKRTLISNLNN